MIVVRNALCVLLAGALIAVGTPRLAVAAPPQAELVQLELERLGVSAEEAAARVAALDQTELDALARALEEQPAGQGFGTVLIAVGAVFILLVILDATGVTDIFPWINKAG